MGRFLLKKEHASFFTRTWRVMLLSRVDFFAFISCRLIKSAAAYCDCLFFGVRFIGSAVIDRCRSDAI